MEDKILTAALGVAATCAVLSLLCVAGAIIVALGWWALLVPAAIAALLVVGYPVGLLIDKIAGF